MGVTKLVLKIRRITDHSISRIFSHSGDSGWIHYHRHIFKLKNHLSCVFNTAYIGLFDRPLLPMSLIQVELALKQAVFKSRTPLSMYQFDPIWIVYEWLKLPTDRFFLFFSIMGRIRKGSDLPRKKWGSPSIQQKY